MKKQMTFTAPELVPDLAVVAQYADDELTAQFTSSATVSDVPSVSKKAVVPDVRDDGSDSSGDEAAVENKEPATEDSSDISSDEENDTSSKFRAKIEAKMIKQDKMMGRPLMTEHEVVAVPVREPSVELTADCPIAQCGRILNVCVPGLMMTIKSNPNTEPLDEGSVLCLEDRTVIGCVDEVFGPVLMPLYLVRFQTTDKIPVKATVNVSVYNATEHTTYIIPDKIKDKGSDASNLFDEEEDETEFSDDEAEAIAKRDKCMRDLRNARKSRDENSEVVSSPDERRDQGGRRGRGGRGLHSGKKDNNSSCHTRQKKTYGGRIYHGHQSAIRTRGMPLPSTIQTQPHGGVTNFTQPFGFGRPRPLLMYGTTNYTLPQPNGVAQPTIHGVNMLQGHQALSNNYYMPPPTSLYSAHNQQFQTQFPPDPYSQYFQPPNAYVMPHQVPIEPYVQFRPPSNSQPPQPPPLPFYGVNNRQALPRKSFGKRN